MLSRERNARRHKVSVVLSAWNQPNAIRLSPTGFAAQDDMDFEMVIADDGLQPEVQDLLCGFIRDLPFPAKFVTQPDEGFGKARILNSAPRRPSARRPPWAKRG